MRLVWFLLVAAMATADARVKCPPRKPACRDAVARCVDGELAVTLCPAGKVRKCRRKAVTRCKAALRQCCPLSGIELCCGPTAGTGGFPGVGTTTTSTVSGATTTSTLVGDGTLGKTCSDSNGCDSLECCAVSGKVCCSATSPILNRNFNCGGVIGAFGQSCNGDQFDVDARCGIGTRKCPVNEPGRPVAWNCQPCADGVKTVLYIRNSQTGENTPWTPAP